MPTYNSERTIEQSLKSIRRQSIDQKQIEILILDGGSTDKTLEIAAQYGAIILKNKKKLPEFAKQQGLLCAQGKYGIFLDSDESFTNMNSLADRLKYLKQYPNVKNLVSTGQICVSGELGVSRYANYIGDPFSNFVYRYNGYNRVEDISRQYRCETIGDALLVDFHDCIYLPLFDALGNMFEIEAARDIFERKGRNSNFAANIFSDMVQETKCAIIMKKDLICHQPGLSRNIYLKKIKWRVKNNLFQSEGIGFAARSKHENGLQKRKVLFVPYCMLLIPVVIDSIRLSIKNRDRYFIYHFGYTQYTFWTIVWYVLLKIIHYPVKMEKTYGK